MVPNGPLNIRVDGCELVSLSPVREESITRPIVCNDDEDALAKVCYSFVRYS